MQALLKYFPTGTTEGERLLLDQTFLTPSQLASILAIPPGSPRLLVGTKGSGKTAILEHLFATAKHQKIPALFLRPDDLDPGDLTGISDIATLKRGMYRCILEAVATAIGTNLRGFLKGPAAKLYEAAVAMESRERDWAGKVLSVLSRISQPITQIDGIKLAEELGRGSPPPQLRQAVDDHLLAENSLFFLLLDDTDQVASPSQPEHLNRIWALLLAARKLTETSPNIRIVVSLRTEVWLRLIRGDDGQRDQTDHLRPLVEMLRSPDHHMEAIFERRLQLAANELDRPYSRDLFFKDDRVLLPTSEEDRSWSGFILKSSRERPRDMIQLVNHLARAAIRAGHRAIDNSDAASAIQPYSDERFADLKVEVGEECDQFLDVMKSFRDVDFEMEFEDLRKHLHSLPSRFSIRIRGKSLRPQEDESAISLLELLHESGFINARISDVRQPRAFRHVTFLDDPHLVRMSRWNELQAARWEVHPVFRSHLISLQSDLHARQLAKQKARNSRRT